ncbi:MAG: UDP-N-acetylmuramate dehydrogenase [Wujia sp.]
MRFSEKIQVIKNEPLALHTTFRIGGPADYFAIPKNTEEIIELIDFCKKNDISYYVIGNGSNILASDAGYRGVIIQIATGMNDIKVEDTRIYAQAGAMLSKVSNMAYNRGLTGMEFASGIPGTVGGAIVMNAGAYGGEMKDIVEYVDVLENGEVRRYRCHEMEFSYRHSIIDEKKIVLGVGLLLQEGDKNAIRDRMQELNQARKEKQPLEYPSAGSTFKRPEGYFAAKLIDDCGLRGYRVGGAMVSQKHCGFVINYDHASCCDVLQLMEDVRNKVLETYGVCLQPEVRILQ